MAVLLLRCRSTKIALWKVPMTEDQISHRIIGVALDVHSHFGPGLFESTYEQALAYDLSDSGLMVKTQVCIPYRYKRIFINSAFRADVIVNDLVLIEVKSVECLNEVHVRNDDGLKSYRHFQFERESFRIPRHIRRKCGNLESWFRWWHGVDGHHQREWSVPWELR